jgi:hypothetical protein
MRLFPPQPRLAKIVQLTPRRQPFQTDGQPANGEADHNANQRLEDIVQKVNLELSASPFPLRQMKCEFRDGSLNLSGVAVQYYYIQLALEIAMRHASGSAITVSVQMTPPPAMPDGRSDFAKQP